MNTYHNDIHKYAQRLVYAVIVLEFLCERDVNGSRLPLCYQILELMSIRNTKPETRNYDIKQQKIYNRLCAAHVHDRGLPGGIINDRAPVLRIPGSSSYLRTSAGSLNESVSWSLQR